MDGDRKQAARAAELAAELGCEVTPHPILAGRVEARDPVPGIYVLVGAPGEVRAEARRCGLLAWLGCLGTLGNGRQGIAA